MQTPDDANIASRALALLREATAGTKYEGRLYLVGGALRDRYLHAADGADLDLVLEGDAIELARMLHHKGLSSHYPVLYPRFGTAMIHLVVANSGVDVELVTARSESYQPDSRKPDVRPGTLKEDIYRRDFTINTLAENLHSCELLDITGLAFQDLDASLIRTPVEPQITFFDDPLRMLRAVRLAARFKFSIEPVTWAAIQAETARLRPPTIAFERIREEFIKIAMLPGEQFRAGVELLYESGLLAEFLPEMLPRIASSLPSASEESPWNQTLLALEKLPDSAPQEVRLALLWHDLASQPSESAELARSIMTRLKFANDDIQLVVELVIYQARLVDYSAEWADAAVKRLIRQTHTILNQLFTLTECICSAASMRHAPTRSAHDLVQLRTRMDGLISAVHIESPLDGNEIMEILGSGPGSYLKDAKDYLLNAVIDGQIQPGDQAAATDLLQQWWQHYK